MKAGRGIYDRGDVSVTTARSARLKNCYKKASKWDRIWGKLSFLSFKLLLSFGFILYAHIEILPVLVSD